MRRILLLALLVLPFGAAHADQCKFQAPRNLQLDLTGVHRVQIDLGSEDLHLTGDGTANTLQLNGRACASEQSMLDPLQVTQRREGDQLIIEVGSSHEHYTINLFGSSYAYLELNMRLPANMPVSLQTNSGDAYVSGLAQLDAHTGSGDLHVSRIAGAFSASAGSGDIEASDVGSLQVGSLGSGDLKVQGVRGDVRVGSVGSGDLTLDQVTGSVHVDTIGSGDVDARNVHGDFIVGAKGSGDVNYSSIGGKVSVPKDED